MPALSRQLRSRHTQRQLFDLVNDVERYPEFISGVNSVKIRSATEKMQVVELGLSSPAMQVTLVTCNHLQCPEQIRMELREGPFSHFMGLWRFQSLDSGQQLSSASSAERCLVSLEMEFEVKSLLLRGLAARFMDVLADRMVVAMSKRAAELYGGEA